MQVYNVMVAKRQERNIITYSSLIAAADRAGRWEEGLITWAHMAGDRCHPNLPAYNSAISCCAQGVGLTICAKVNCAVLCCPVLCSAVLCYAVPSYVKQVEQGRCVCQHELTPVTSLRLDPKVLLLAFSSSLDNYVWCRWQVAASTGNL